MKPIPGYEPMLDDKSRIANNGVSFQSDDDVIIDADENAATDTNPSLYPRVYTLLDNFFYEDKPLHVGDRLNVVLRVYNYSLGTITNIRPGRYWGNISDSAPFFEAIESIPHGQVAEWRFSLNAITEDEYAIGSSEGLVEILFVNKSGNTRSVYQESTVMMSSGRRGAWVSPPITSFTEPTELTYNHPNRDLSICFKLKDGNAIFSDSGYLDSYSVEYAILADEVIRYDFTNSLENGSGVSFGSSSAGTCTLEIDKRVVYRFREMEKRCNRTALYAYIGIRDSVDSDYSWTPFGAWLVDSIDEPEQSLTATITGSDYLNAYETTYTLFADLTNYGSSGITYGAYFNNVIKTFLVPPWNGEQFTNWTVRGVKSPDYGNSGQLRPILSWIADVAGGYVLIDKKGYLGIRSFANAKEYNIDADLYTEVTKSPIQFLLDGIWLNDPDDFYRQRVYLYGMDSVDRWGSYSALRNRVFISGKNPLMATDSIRKNCMQNVFHNVRYNAWHRNGKYALDSGTIQWIGDPLIKLGDILTATDTNGDLVRIMVQSNHYTYDAGGLTETITCDFGGDYDSRTKFVINGVYLNSR